VLFCEELYILVQEATEKVLEDLLGQHEAEKSKLSSSLAALETTRTELEQRIAVLTDKLNEKNDDTGIGPSVADPGCLSRIRLFSISDPGSELSPSRIRIKEFKF
jgi:hypothetical protein